MQRCCIAKRLLNFYFKQESSRTIFFSPNVNINSIRRSYNWVELSKTTGAECMEAPCHSFTSSEQSARCPVLTLTVQIQPPHWTKCKWLWYKTLSLQTIIWMSYWYNIVWNVVLCNIVSYDNVNELKESELKHPFFSVL